MTQSPNPSQTHLEVKLREVLKQHQRDGLSMIGGVERLVGSLVRAVEEWIEEERRAAEKRTA
jgi:hypothetical protein